MKTLVSASAHFALTPDGHLWTPNASLSYQFWTRYLDVYDEVRLLAQAAPYAQPPEDWNCATGPGIVAAPVPDFLTPRLLVKNLGTVKKIVRETLQETQGVHLRDCFLGNLVRRALVTGRPYGVEVVADPYDVFAPGAFQHPLRPVLRRWASRELKNQCARATAAAYVTKDALQRRYPPAKNAFATHFSSINLLPENFVVQPRALETGRQKFHLLLVGTLAQLYKAPDVLLKAVAACIQTGLNLQLTFVGDGHHRAQLEAQAKSLNIAERVIFRGQLSDRQDVQKELDAADLFVLPSHQEGLPRAMVEAMARALPCIGSTVGGIPELLPAEDLVPPGDADALAKKIGEVLRDPNRMAQMSAYNLKTSHEYEEGVLRARREEFYSYVRKKTQAWHNGKADN